MAWQSDVDERLLHSGALDPSFPHLSPLIPRYNRISTSCGRSPHLGLIFCTDIYTGVDICQGYSHVIVDKVKYTITKERSKVCPMRSP
ncbi:unnamed protein product, partial [Musa acuminata var. zebrina]